MDSVGFISVDGNKCYVGESLGGVEVAIEESTATKMLAIRYANVKLGWLENAPNARLRPPAYVERWEKKLESEKDKK